MSNPTWKIDEAHSSIRFSVRHMVVATVHGQFRRFSTELTFSEPDIARASVVVRVETDSIDTGHPGRDADLRSENFFDAARFPLLTFESRRVERSGESTFRVIGDLTLRNVTKALVLEVEHGGFVTDPWGARRVGFSVRASVERSEFGMVWNQLLEAGGVAVSDRVDIHAEVEAVAAAAQAA